MGPNGRAFGDIWTNRGPSTKIEVLENGPVLARVKYTDEKGFEKTYSVWAGMPWVEMTTNRPIGWLRCYDNIDVMGAESKTPGSYLYSDGTTGKILKTAAKEDDCLVKRWGQYWAAKYSPKAR